MHITMHAPARARPLDHALAFFAVAMFALFCTASLHTHGAALHVDAPARSTVGAETPFEYVAVFASGTSGRDIEAWRASVLARPHAQGCARGRSCTQRLLRLSALGQGRAEVLAFDLAADTPAAERRAIVDAIATATPRAAIHAMTSPRHAVGD